MIITCVSHIMHNCFPSLSFSPVLPCRDQPWVVVPISAKYNTNVDGLIQWLLKQKTGGR